MRTKIAVLVASILIAVTAFARNPQTDQRLQQVKSIFISGNNQSAEQARRAIPSTCFTLATKPSDADAVLDISTDTQSQGSTGFGAFGAREWIASGTLTLTSGDLVWSRSERFGDTAFRSGGKISGKLLIHDLAKDAGCGHRR